MSGSGYKRLLVAREAREGLAAAPSPSYKQRSQNLVFSDF
jgi:hypothetical protein